MMWHDISTAPKDGTEVYTFGQRLFGAGRHRLASYSMRDAKDGGNGFYGASHWWSFDGEAAPPPPEQGQ